MGGRSKDPVCTTDCAPVPAAAVPSSQVYTALSCVHCAQRIPNLAHHVSWTVDGEYCGSHQVNVVENCPKAITVVQGE